MRPISILRRSRSRRVTYAVLIGNNEIRNGSASLRPRRAPLHFCGSLLITVIVKMSTVLQPVNGSTWIAAAHSAPRWPNGESESLCREPFIGFRFYSLNFIRICFYMLMRPIFCEYIKFTLHWYAGVRRKRKVSAGKTRDAVISKREIYLTAGARM